MSPSFSVTNHDDSDGQRYWRQDFLAELVTLRVPDAEERLRQALDLILNAALRDNSSGPGPPQASIGGAE